MYYTVKDSNYHGAKVFKGQTGKLVGVDKSSLGPAHDGITLRMKHGDIVMFSRYELDMPSREQVKAFLESRHNDALRARGDSRWHEACYLDAQRGEKGQDDD